jgi:signal transduction histidine kinase/CheY-like chemotaxis protein
MNGLPLGFAKLYADALKSHLAQARETALHQAYELGRQALSEGISMLDLTLLHHEALADLQLDQRAEGDLEWMELAAEFLAECLSPFEMTLRGFRESNLRLGEANEQLRRAKETIQAAHEELIAETAERQRAEAALRHSQRLQAVGRLAGGVAHHFNNLLMVVMGNLEMARNRAGGDEKLGRLLEAAWNGAERGASVTRELLAFSRQQAVSRQVVDTSERLHGAVALLAGSLRGDVAVDADIPDDLWTIEIDPTQLELALLNLGLNARDAMPAGGRLTVRAANRGVEARESGESGRGLGDHVVIEVSDTGTGISPDILPQIFDPFFTTKAVGAGTGLGLSQVYGFAQQSLGAVDVDSRPGEGTTFRLYLPASKARTTAAAAAQHGPAASTETVAGAVLVVDDDEAVAAMAADLFESWGFSVKLAHRGGAALELLAADRDIDLVFADIIMPGGMNGFELAEAVRKDFPEIPILLTTGYSGDIVPAARGLDIIGKPYRAADLRDRIEGLLRGRRV